MFLLYSSAINISAAQYFPAAPLYQDDHFSVAVSPSISIKGLAINLNGSYANKGWSIGGGIGMGSSGLSAGGSVGYRAFSYYYSYVGGGTENAQSVGGLSVNDGDFSLRFENDFFAQSGDRRRTGGIELGYGDVILGTQIYTNNPRDFPGTEEEKVDFDGTNLRGQLNTPRNGKKYGAWKKDVGIVSSSPLYIGFKYQNSFVKLGVNHPMVQDRTQNVIHRNIVKQHYYNSYTDYKGLYFQVANRNPFSIYNY